MSNKLSLFEDSTAGQSDVQPSKLPRDLAILALGEIQGVGRVTAVKLFETTDITALFRASRDQVLWVASKAQIAAPDAFADVFCKKRDEALKCASETLEKYDRFGVKVIFDDDPLYPKALTSMADRPRWLIVRGNVELLNADRLVTLVGTRKPTQTGLKLAERVAKILVNHGFVIVSGLAEGIDAVAHREAVAARGQTIAVLGTGIFNDFPNATAPLRTPIINNGGALVTEFFDKEQYSKQHFVQRNRIQAALSPMTIPVEAAVPSGTLHTITFAKRYRKVVIGVRWEDQADTDLHAFLRDEGFEIVTIPAFDDPLLTSLGRSYDFAGFLQKSHLERNNAIVGRIVSFARRLIISESLSRLDVERIIRCLQEDAS